MQTSIFLPVQFHKIIIYSFDLINVSLLPSRFYGNAYCTRRYFPEQTRTQKSQKVIFHVTNLFDSKSTGNEKEILSDFILPYFLALKLIIYIFSLFEQKYLVNITQRRYITLYKYFCRHITYMFKI